MSATSSLASVVIIANVRLHSPDARSSNSPKCRQCRRAHRRKARLKRRAVFSCIAQCLSINWLEAGGLYDLPPGLTEHRLHDWQVFASRVFDRCRCRPDDTCPARSTGWRNRRPGLATTHGVRARHDQLNHTPRNHRRTVDQVMAVDCYRAGCSIGQNLER
jgi:hypothetical protein